MAKRKKKFQAKHKAANVNVTPVAQNEPEVAADEVSEAVESVVNEEIAEVTEEVVANETAIEAQATEDIAVEEAEACEDVAIEDVTTEAEATEEATDIYEDVVLEDAEAEEPVSEQIHENSVLEEPKKDEGKKSKKSKTPKSPKAPKKKAVARKDMTKLQWTLHEIKRNKIAYLMIAPFMLIFTLFTVFPVGMSLVLSFTNFNMLEFNWEMFQTGFGNYTRLFLKDEIFLLACKNTLVFAAVTGPVSYVLSFLVAWFINELSPRIRAIVTLIFYAPSISSNVYLIWGTLFHNDSQGWVNGILMKMNIIDAPILWFYDEKYAMTLCIIVALWMSLGTAFLSFIAGLQTVDKSLFEAAAVDGIKNRWQELWYITLPMMRPQLMFGAVMSITGAFGFGGVVTALCGFPSVNYSCHTIMHCLEDYGNQRWEVGYASAIAVVLFLVMIGANTLVNKMLSKVGQ